MNLLNLGCGGVRDQSPHWINLDELHSQLPPGSGAREQLDREQNYVNFQLLSAPLPFNEGSFDGILCGHVVEHFNTQDSLKLLGDCRRVLKPGGLLMVSVPDASYFRKVHAADCNANWERLFDVVDPNNPIPTFMQAALFFEQHMQLLTSDALWCYFKQMDFGDITQRFYREGIGWTKAIAEKEDAVYNEMQKHLNRHKFSLVMTGVKTP